MTETPQTLLSNSPSSDLFLERGCPSPDPDHKEVTT